MDTDLPASHTTNNTPTNSRRLFLQLLGIGAATMATTSCGVDLTTVRWEHVPTPTALTPTPDELLRTSLREYCLALQRNLLGQPSQGATTPALAQLNEQVTKHLSTLGPQYISGLPEPTPTTVSTPSDPPATTPGEPQAIAELLPRCSRVVTPNIAAATGQMAYVAGLIQATYQTWAHWLTKSAPEPLLVPPQLDQPAPEAFQQALTAALENRYATVYHYGALAQNQPKPVTAALAKHLTRHDGTTALLQEAARRAQVTAPAPHVAYTALAAAPVDQNAQKLEHSCRQATGQLLKSCPATWRTWVIQLATGDALAATAWGQAPQNLLP